MTIVPKRNINVLEGQKFQLDTNSDVCVNVCLAPGSAVTPSGLGAFTVAGQNKTVTLNSSTMTKLNDTAFAGKAISIQNNTTIAIKVNFDSSVVTFTGTTINPEGERFYNIEFDIFAIAESGTPTIDVEELK